jgi:hypothetical protein
MNFKHNFLAIYIAKCSTHKRYRGPWEFWVFYKKSTITGSRSVFKLHLKKKTTIRIRSADMVGKLKASSMFQQNVPFNLSEKLLWINI